MGLAQCKDFILTEVHIVRDGLNMNGIYYAVFLQIHYLSLLSNPTRSESGDDNYLIIVCATAQARPGNHHWNHQSSSNREKKARVLELATSKIQYGVFAKAVNFEIFSHF